MPRPWLARLSISCCRAASAVYFDRNGCPAFITETKQFSDKIKWRPCEQTCMKLLLQFWRDVPTRLLNCNVKYINWFCKPWRWEEGMPFKRLTNGKPATTTKHNDNNKRQSLASLFVPQGQEFSAAASWFKENKSKCCFFFWGQHSPCSTAMSSPKDWCHMFQLTWRVWTKKCLDSSCHDPTVVIHGSKLACVKKFG